MSLSEEQHNQFAAKVLAHLIYFGLATAPAAALPEDWRAPYEAARAQVGGGLVPRRQAFLNAIADSPFSVHMEMEVDEAYEAIENRPNVQLRVYSAWATPPCHSE